MSRSIGRKFRWQAAILAGIALMMLPSPSAAMPVEATAPAKAKSAEFKYVGGTEKIPEQCNGVLEVTPASLIYKCPDKSVEIPYDSIVVMQYRSDVSGDLHRMNLNWLFHPWSLHHKTNRYFTVVYTQEGQKHAVVFDVPAKAMRPYLAEIELESGRRVDVENHEDYDY